VRQVLAIVGSCVLLLLLLRFATTGADSATSVSYYLPSPTPSPDEECAAFARFWIDISQDDPDGVSAVSRCRRDADSGAWIEPLADDELNRRDEARIRDIKTQLADLETVLPVDLRRALADLQNPIEPSMHRVDLGAELGPQYMQELENYLQDPTHRKLATYVAWVVARRDAAVATFLEGCAAYPRMNGICNGVGRAVGAGQAPWPWQLNDDLILAEYLAHRPQRDAQILSTEPAPSPGAD
jgi:hypothetical protein